MRDTPAHHRRESLEQQLRSFGPLLQITPIATVITDVESTVVAWNPAAERLFGYSVTEATGRHIDDLLANRDDLRDEATRYNELAVAGERFEIPARRTKKDGTLVDVELLGAPVVADGKRVGAYAIYHDVSEVVRQKRYLESLLEISPTAIVTIDTEAIVTSWNPAAERLFGYTREDALGQNIDALVAADQSIREEADEYSRRGVGGEELRHITHRTRKDGSLVDVELLAAPILLGDEVTGAYAIYHDVSELVAARKQAEEANQAKSTVLATMSHEIRTPMNAVLGMADLLLDTELSAKQRGYAEILRQGGDDLLRILNDILDFSKIEAGRIDLEQRPFNVRECVAAALELISPAASEKGLELAYLVDRGVPERLVGDVTRVRQVLVNLLHNAVKFTEEGEVVLTVQAERSGQPDRLHFTVRDTGIGIPADRLADVFESFSQVDPSATRRHGGSGLGLAISKRLSTFMGGDLWAESEEGTGSTFHLTIVAEAAPADAKIEPGPSADLQGSRVLIVEDNPIHRELLLQYTASWGMLPRASESPRAALSWIERGDPFDVAIIDMQMPTIDGIALAREIRRHRDERSLPLLLLTSLGRQHDPDTGTFAATLAKPIRQSELFDVLAEALGVTPPRRKPAPDAPSHSEGPSLRILLAEDNVVNRDLALLMLQRIGYRADVAADGLEALAALRRKPYDVVLMDVQMPELDGLEATRRIHSEWGDARPRIIAMTANAMEGDRETCLAHGMDDYLAKPVRMEDLRAALSPLVGSAPTVGGAPMAHPTEAAPDRPGLRSSVTLERLRASLGDDRRFAQLIGTFLEDSSNLVEQVASAVAKRDVGKVGRAAHTLKSNAAQFGASELFDLCRELERSAHSKTLDRAGELLERIRIEHDRVAGALEERRKELSS